MAGLINGVVGGDIGRGNNDGLFGEAIGTGKSRLDNDSGGQTDLSGGWFDAHLKHQFISRGLGAHALGQSGDTPKHLRGVFVVCRLGLASGNAGHIFPGYTQRQGGGDFGVG